MFSNITAAPAKQSVSDTISVLSGRLSSATLLEDRRAAILGLRSFAKSYPASVASGALRSLIGSLSKDGEDFDTVKIVLETLLMLFSPNEDSPEASDDIALWLADEFTQHQENITLLLDMLGSGDFYSRLYALQFLAAILSARTERTEECVLAAGPNGIPRLGAILDDRREAIRNEVVTLLTYLTPASVDIQKLVAFESAFERIFQIIAQEGGLLEGARVVEDCLILLANLLRLNAPNQAMFREMGYISQLGRLLESAYKGQKDGQEVASWALAQRNRNIYALLAVIRLFLVAGATGMSQNQAAFLQDGLLESTLELAFAPGVEMKIRAEALETSADMIRANAKLQERFGKLQIYSPLELLAQQRPHQTNGVLRVFAIDGLLDLTLAVSAPEAFGVRLAACDCLTAYFAQHSDIRLHFLQRAIEGHRLGANEPTNVLSTLLQPPTEAAVTDPYRLWFASVLMFHLLHENATTKILAMSVTVGDEASGEEVVTSIQTITAHLLDSISKPADMRIIVGYQMLLLCWLFEDLDAVNDFLAEGGNVQRLIQAAVQNPNGDVIVQGLSAMLLGVVYEFSTKDSPVSRASLWEIIMSRMGRDRYVDKLSRLRSHPLIRDHEVLARNPGPGADQRLPDVFFDDRFVEFFKDNYSRVLRAVDRDPSLEISVITDGVQKGISRDMVDSLRAQLEENERVLQSAQTERMSLTKQLSREQADHRRTKEWITAEIGRAREEAAVMRAQLEARDGMLRDAEAAKVMLEKQLAQEQANQQRFKGELVKLKSINESLQRHHQDELVSVLAEQRAKEQELQKQVDSAQKMAESDRERLRLRSEAEKADLKATISRLEVDLMRASKAKSDAETRCMQLEEAVNASAERLAEARKSLRTLEENMIKQRLQDEARLRQMGEEKKAIQGELDDLLMVFADLEEKVSRYEERLRSMGESVTDGEDSAGEEERDGE